MTSTVVAKRWPEWVARVGPRALASVDLTMAATPVGLTGAGLLAVGTVAAVLNRMIPRIRSRRRVVLCRVPSRFEAILAKDVQSLTHTIWIVPLIGRFLPRFRLPFACETVNGFVPCALALLVNPRARRGVDIVRGHDPAITGVLAVWLRVLTGLLCLHPRRP